MDGINESILHLPIYSLPDWMDVAVVFRPQPHTLGVLYFAKRFKGGKLFGTDSPLGGTLDAALFPPNLS